MILKNIETACEKNRAHFNYFSVIADNKNSLEYLFGPYDMFPRFVIDRSNGGKLMTTLTEDIVTETEQYMTIGKWIKHLLGLYDPLKNKKVSIEWKFGDAETLVESGIDEASVITNEGKYYVRARGYGR